MSYFLLILAIIVIILAFGLQLLIKQRGGSYQSLKNQLSLFEQELHQLTTTPPDPAKTRDFVVRLDNFMKDALYYKNITEQTLGEQLKSEKTKRLFNRDQLNWLWFLHKMRNQVVHENYNPIGQELKNVGYVISVLRQSI